MPKLSRMDKYREVRSQIEDTNQNVKPLEKEEKKTGSSIRLAAPDKRVREKDTLPSQQATPVIDDVIGEVKQYNLENGELVTEDTQMQILYDLSENRDPAARRQKHLETMESNEAAGGTTLNIYGSSLDAVPASSAPVKAASQAAPVKETQTKPAAQPKKTAEPVKKDTKVVLGKKELEADPAAESDQLDLFAAKTPSEPVKQAERRNKEKEQAAAAKKKQHKKEARQTMKKAEAVRETEAQNTASAAKAPVRKERREDAEETSGSKAGNVIIGILIILLIALIVLCIFWMKKLGIF